VSSFLAPIHFWVYNKIKIQDDLIRTIAQTANSKGLVKDIDTFAGEVPADDLRAVIDLSNIHGWLQNTITKSEQRLAALVTMLINIDEAHITFIESAAYAFGAAHAIPPHSNAQAAHKFMLDMLVNGMPCDNVESVIVHLPEKVVWQNIKDVHAPHWMAIGGDPSYYWRIRFAIMCGMCTDCLLSCKRLNDNSFEITVTNRSE